MIFITCPKKFDSGFLQIQSNAICSWMDLYPTAKFIICVEKPPKHILDDERVEYIRDVESEDDVPYVSALFEEATKRATAGEPIVYINADIILLPSFRDSLEKIPLKRKFLITGGRWDCDSHEEIDFSRKDWHEHVRREAVKNGRLHDHSGKDYFVFNKDTYKKIPRFLLGRFYWDSWLYRYCKSNPKIFYVDITRTAMAIHQNHPKIENNVQFDYNLKLYRRLKSSFRKNKINNFWSKIDKKGRFVLVPSGRKNVVPTLNRSMLS